MYSNQDSFNIFVFLSQAIKFGFKNHKIRAGDICFAIGQTKLQGKCFKHTGEQAHAFAGK